MQFAQELAEAFRHLRKVGLSGSVVVPLSLHRSQLDVILDAVAQQMVEETPDDECEDLCAMRSAEGRTGLSVTTHKIRQDDDKGEEADEDEVGYPWRHPAADTGVVLGQ